MRVSLIIILLLSYNFVLGQISTMEEPVSFRTDIPASQRDNVAAMKSFAQLDMQRIMQEDIEDEELGIPPRFGYKRSVNYNLENSGEWLTLPDGGRIWRLTLSSPGALSINLLYDKFWLPDGAKFWIYSTDRRHSIGAFTSFNNMGDRDDIQGFATGLIFSDEITLEYYLPKGIEEVGVISIAYVVHGYRHIRVPSAFERLGFGQSDWCQVNVSCPEGQNWRNEANAVALILVNGNRHCTGFLINTTANDNRPLFMTAAHCLLGWDAVGNNSPFLPTWSFIWHYKSPTCANPNTAPTMRSTVGARLVANNSVSVSDFALFDLSGNNSDPRNRTDVTPYFLGWDRSGNPGTGGVGIHHPNGDIKKISTYTMTPQSANVNGNLVTNGGFWRINWVQTSTNPIRHGITARGSSGSPLINSNRRVIGQLFGGTTYCDPTHIPGWGTGNRNTPDWYGKLSVSWTSNGATDNRRRLNHWLDPLNTGTTVLNGMGVCVYTFPNQPLITEDKTVWGCDNLEVENVRVTNNARLTIDAPGTVRFGPGFRVEAGASLRVKPE